MSQNIIFFWIRSVSSFAYGSATDADYNAVKVKAHIWKLRTSLHEELCSESTYFVVPIYLYLFLSERCLPQTHDTFYTCPVVAAEQVV